MRYLFDASSVYTIVKAGKTQLLILSNTCELARYETGNILLTERHKRKTITETEQISLLNLISRSLNLMSILSVRGYEQEIVSLAGKYNLSFYDASYVYLAIKNNATLVTEDSKLVNKIGAYIEVTTASNLCK